MNDHAQVTFTEAWIDFNERLAAVCASHAESMGKIHALRSEDKLDNPPSFHDEGGEG